MHLSSGMIEEISNPGKDTNRRAYKLIDIEKYQPSGVGSPKLTSSQTADTIKSIAQLYDFVKTYDKNFSPNPVNPALLNEDGTPKIWYHGSPAAFSAFDKKKAKSPGLYGKGFYFTNSSTHAGQ